ncbi:hypothetical protein D8B26_002233 [Coccidioides posadasii str. Silveira]|uniref:uncharacterized protein n=1 Tax=Coccidioides posadasii (strain RMSCC 757 / Silveira) TaxID=443226 RepID=UPI001BEE51C5|nr:hypothetical protein D8B26_002233 [Coccidioides posadasii str. Silveira]
MDRALNKVSFPAPPATVVMAAILSTGQIRLVVRIQSTSRSDAVEVTMLEHMNSSHVGNLSVGDLAAVLVKSPSAMV